MALITLETIAADLAEFYPSVAWRIDRTDRLGRFGAVIGDVIVRRSGAPEQGVRVVVSPGWRGSLWRVHAWVAMDPLPDQGGETASDAVAGVLQVLGYESRKIAEAVRVARGGRARRKVSYRTSKRRKA